MGLPKGPLPSMYMHLTACSAWELKWWQIKPDCSGIPLFLFLFSAYPYATPCLITRSVLFARQSLGSGAKMSIKFAIFLFLSLSFSFHFLLDPRLWPESSVSALISYSCSEKKNEPLIIKSCLRAISWGSSIAVNSTWKARNFSVIKREPKIRDKISGDL